MGRTIQITGTASYRNVLTDIETTLAALGKPAIMRNFKRVKIESDATNAGGSKIYWARGDYSIDTDFLLPEDSYTFDSGGAASRESISDLFYKGNGLKLNVTLDY